MSLPTFHGQGVVRVPQKTTFAITGPITPSDLPGLCDRICSLLESSAAGVAICDVAGVPVDATTVDALARLQLGAHRRGCVVRLRNASPELISLVAFMGLANVLPEG
jgi:ABC-type transporter Mla MlaB component